MQLAATRIITDDVDALVAFYETATGITAVRLHPMFAELRTTSGTLAIASSATVPLLGDNAGRGAGESQHHARLPRQRRRRNLSGAARCCSDIRQRTH